jgi:polar amino acid transport system substrate-binding protein
MSTTIRYTFSRAQRRSGQFFLGLLAALILFACPAKAAEVLRIGYTEFPPFHWHNDEGNVCGFFHDIIQEAAKRMNFEVEWTQCPWGRCQENVRLGELDGLLTVPTTERLEYTVTNKTPFYVKHRHLFTYAGHPRLDAIRSVKTIDDIAQKGLSVITYVGNGAFNREISSYDIKVYTTTTIPRIWKMLAIKRGDIVIEWPTGAWENIRRLGLEGKIIETESVLESLPFHLLIRKGHPLAKRTGEFEATFRQMKQDGTMDRILKGHHTE